MFRFVADNVAGAGTKRKASPRTCEACKRRHKRCAHNAQPERSSPLASSSHSPTIPDAPPPPQSLSGTAAVAASGSQSFVKKSDGPNGGGGGAQSASTSEASGVDEAHLRFVANLSPESAFIINANRKGAGRDISTHGVGLWLGQKPEDVPAEEEPAPVYEGKAGDVPAPVLDGSAGQVLLLSSLRPALRRECIATIPPDYELGLMMDFFYAKIDPMFPLLRDEPWEKHGFMETLALKQCICLVASLDPSMRPHLRLPHTEAILPQVEFRARMAAAVKQSLDLGFLADKVVLMQVCTLMSMYVEKQGFGELSTYYCAQAVLHEQTLGFHVGWPVGKAGADRSRRIFWCVWVLDRLNAAMNGRPTLIHQRDLEPKVISSVDDQPPAFKLLIRIAEFLEDTISLYRPGDMLLDRPKATDPTFEELVETTGAQNLSNGLLASLELFYLSVVILRGKPAAQGPSSELQWFCAARIVAVASGEHKASLVFWPVLPFSVTVAASVAYRSLRNSTMPYNRKRAYSLFQDSCEVLEDLSKAFLSARAMARLAMDTMQEVERVAAERTRRDSIRPPETAGTPAEQVSLVDASSRGSQDVSQPQSGPVTPGVTQPLAAGVANMVLPASGDQLEPNFFDQFDGEAGVFGNLDPSFDLDRIDAIFSANLDPSAPHFVERWPGAESFTWSGSF